MKRRLYARCVIVCLLMGQPCIAETRDAPTAEALFRAGRDALQRGDVEEARKRFEESYRLDAAPGTLLNLATCFETLGLLAESWESYRHVAESLAPTDDRLPWVQQQLAALDSRLPRLTLQLAARDSSIKVLRDGMPLATAALGVPLPMNPGQHRVTVRAEKRLQREYVVLLSEGQHLSLTLEPGEASVVEVPKVAAHVGSRKPVSSPLREQFEYALWGAGAASLTAAAVTGNLYFAAAAAAHDGCPTSNTCTDAGLKAAGRADSLQTVTIVTGAVGLSALAGAAVLWATAHGSGAKPTPRAGIRLELGLSGASIRGRF